MSFNIKEYQRLANKLAAKEKMRLTNLEQKIIEIISPVVQELGLELLWVEYKGGILGVFAENPNTGKLTIDECTQISREISPILEVEDPIKGAYRLEVSSAGIDRPLLKPSDYDRYKDLEVKIEVDEMIDGQKKFRGILRESDDNKVIIDTDHGSIELPFLSIIKAKPIMSEELIKVTKKRFESNNNSEEEEIKVIN